MTEDALPPPLSRLLRHHPALRLWAAVMALVLVLLPSCSKYDQLVSDYQGTEEAWANVQAQLQRRYDLIPNLVETVKASAAHEQETLAAVISARSKATSIQLSAEDLSDPEKMKQLQAAEGELNSALSRLMMVQESYPDLKANAAFKDLQVQLEGTENRILRSREEYNKAVRQYNTTLMQVKGSAVNKLTGKPFEPRVYFEAGAAAQGEPPKVEF
nr:LemA family protein [Enhygromyxa salina]